MAVDPHAVKISSPCPTTLDPNRHKGGKKSFYCGHCDKAVHILSNMTEAEAGQLMSKTKGDNICVSYSVTPDGKVRFKAPAPVQAPTIVPLTALSRRMGNRSAVVAAVGFTAALAACTPHDKDGIGETPPIVVEDREEMRDGKMEYVPEVPVEQQDEIVEGEMAPPDEPCEKPTDDPEPPDQEPIENDMMVAGLMAPEAEPVPVPEEAHIRRKMAMPAMVPDP